jgi:DNA-binding PadR family transcriptional regulator
MSVEFAILALLSSGPLSGYDIKKLFSASESLPWSGNNNQVYRSLVELHRTGFTDLEILQPAEGPARKLYTLTARGSQALHEWLTADVELPAFRAPVFARLIGADLLSDDELDQLLSQYDEELRLKVLGLEELERRGTRVDRGSERQRLIWQRIHNRPAAIYRSEQEWVAEIRWALAKLQSGKNPRLERSQSTRGPER